MRRREFISLLAAAAAAPLPPVAADAQQPQGNRRMGVLHSAAENDPEGQERLAALRQGLKALGWREGRNLRIDYRWAAGDAARVKAFAAELVALAPDAILTSTTIGVRELHRLTRTIPIVFANVADPIGSKLVSNLPHPGENVTGFTTVEYAIAGKWLEILKEIAPRITRVGFMFNPVTGPQGEGFYRLLSQAGTTFGVTAVKLTFQSRADVEAAIDTFARPGNGGLLAAPELGTIAQRHVIIAAAMRNRIPAVYPLRFFAVDGGPLSYGVDLSDQWRLAAGYLDRIWHGERAGDLPVQAPTKYQLVVNLNATKALGLNVPATLLGRADEVIE
jgi:putative ABC transport system substrate-binding protein